MEDQKNAKVSKKILVGVISALSLVVIMLSLTIYQALQLSNLKSEVSLLKSDKTNLESQLADKSNIPPTTEEPKNIPENFVEYKNNDLNFSFAYPKEWGELKFEAENNGRKIGKFSANQEFFVKLNRKDISQLDGDDPTDNMFDYTVTKGIYTLKYTFGEQTLTSTEVLETSETKGKTYILYQTKGLGYYFGALGKLAANSEYDSVIFSNSRGRSDEPFGVDDQEVAILAQVLGTFKVH